MLDNKESTGILPFLTVPIDPVRMNALTIKFPGILQDPADGHPVAKARSRSLPNPDQTQVTNTETLRLQRVYEVIPASRSEANELQTEELTEKEVVEFTFDDGSFWLGDYTTLDEVFPTAARQMRSLDGADEGVVLLPAEFATGTPDRSGLLEKVLLEFISIFTRETVVEPAVRELAVRFEDRQLDQGPGLFELTEAFELVKAGSLTDGHYLLFIHGTASSTLGSFDKLKNTDVWKMIRHTYPGRVLAFEHRTLSESPLENVRDLLDQLPDKATLTVISHSRGGLVGDVLNRFFPGKAEKRGFSTLEKDFLRKQDRPDDIRLIEEIEPIARRKDLTIDRFVRVACTASGTTLASRRLDIYFNVLLNLLGLALSGPLFIVLKDLLSTAIKTKDDTSVLPGLEVQNPRSPFNQVLNNAAPETVIDTPLLVIAGDAEMSMQWKAIRVALTNLFFWTGNDFVVDTASMYNGARRAEGRVQYFFDRSEHVSHFSYFHNPGTREALRLALNTAAGSPVAGFSPLTDRSFTKAEVRNIALALPGGRVFEDKVSGNRPIVVLLPGIMGSTLSAGNDSLWIDLPGFVFGGLTDLNMDNRSVVADGLVASSYRRLTKYLQRDYDVVTFPFDWRSDMETNANILNVKLRDLLRHQQPIKLIGHSMGGVLIRDFMLSHPTTWKRLKESRDFQLLFLGSPLNGSFRILYVLFGLDEIIGTLDLVDLKNTRKDLLALFSQFPGILSLLPIQKEDTFDFSNPALWQTLRTAFGDKNWPLPKNELLEGFGSYRANLLPRADQLLDDRAVYIAGQSRKDKQTISGYRIVEKGGRTILEFVGTKEGDESVTWDSITGSGLIDPDHFYFSDVPHGELANDPKLFPAITDILNRGTTTRLSRNRPAVRGLEKEFPAKTTFDFNLTPDGVENSLLGLSSETVLRRSQVPILVSVSHGDLKYAQYPVMVGHFEKDSILYAEKDIDRYLNNELSNRHQLGLYPGAFGTSEVVLNKARKGFPGALIVGLGREGDLSEVRLSTCVEGAASRYLIELNHQSDPGVSAAGDAAQAGAGRTGLSALLVGSSYGGLRIEHVVRAIIQGIQNANNKILKLFSAPQLIETVEFIELYKDRALACLKAVSAIEKEDNQSLNITRIGKGVKPLTGGRERLPLDNTSEWWTRIAVHEHDRDGQKSGSRKVLRFTISTDAARMEERFLYTVDDSLKNLVDNLSTRNNWSPELARTLFEMMIPNDFKDQVKRQNNIIWNLDKYTAGFPWELLQDDTPGTRPLSVNAGMIRQLATRDFRININPVTERSALVIGDPDLKKPPLQLPAAEEEGKAMARLLQLQGYSVTPLIRSSAEQILQNLYCRNYKIAHFAAHGIFSADPEKPTGMLIGPDAYLTPAHIQQMSSVPDLVFVNCCFLGQTDGNSETMAQSRTQLAANLGTQLIDIGVKAVVVAGWAVHDEAALEFANRFYQCMFSGNNFGQSILRARRAVYDRFGSQTNTWGAYQCYGDPQYRLSAVPNEGRVHSYDFVSADEAEIEVTNLLNAAEARQRNSEQVLLQMEAIEKALEKADLSSPKIIERQALLYAAINEYEKAIDRFNALCLEERATFSFQAMEKYCNVRAKFYTRKAKESDKPDGEDALKALEEVIRDLKGLLAFGETAERLNLLASTYKRLGQFAKTGKKRANYEQAIQYYQKAARVPGNSAVYYPMSNWIPLAYALAPQKPLTWSAEEGAPPQPVISILDKLLEETNRQAEGEDMYWDRIARCNLLLCEAIIGEKVPYDQLFQQYKDVWEMIGHKGQRQTELEHLENLKVALLINKSHTEAAQEVINRLYNDLSSLE